MNPLIYNDRGSVFTNITSGNNHGCDSPGFHATVGWDPVAGPGTPIFDSPVALVYNP